MVAFSLHYSVFPNTETFRCHSQSDSLNFSVEGQFQIVISLYLFFFNEAVK